MHRTLRLPALALLASLLACTSDTTGPTQKTEAQLTFLRYAVAAPPFESVTVAFWAVKGENREGSIYFLDQNGQRGQEFARLRVDATSLSALPDGTPIATGDSVLITMRVDTTRLEVELEPAGLAFSASRPAFLRVDYDSADPDFNDDGSVDAEDSVVESLLAIWRQRAAGEPYQELGTARFEPLKRLEAELTGFSRYAIAY
jgi:hypothetical protein